MNSSLQELANKLNGVGSKTKKHVDRVYLFALFLFVAAQACCLTNTVGQYVLFLLDISSILLTFIGIYRILFELCSNLKKALLMIAVVLFGFVYTINTNEALPFSPVAFAIIGALGVNADYVLFAGIGGNLVMIITNIIITLTGEAGFYINKFQDRDFFYLGDNVFYVSKWNNCSSTDLAAHYFWMIAVYLWIRGKKLTWGELFALGALDFVVYSLTGGNTSFLCIALMLFCVFVLKILAIFKARTKTSDKKANSSGSGIFAKFTILFKNVFVFCIRYSYLIIAFFCILFAVLFKVGNPIYEKLNQMLHFRLSLGHRGIVENGIHLIATDVPSFGMASSADEFYNFLDCSFIYVLVNCGLLLLLFYILSMTIVQIKHKKYIFGLIILAVCAFSCVEEHHLSQLPYNLFPLLLFADIEKIKTDNKEPVIKKKNTLIISLASFLICLVFLAATVLINLPRFKAVKNLDRLDGKASDVYMSVQANIDDMLEDGSWQEKTAAMSSYQLGEVIVEEPVDFKDVTGTYWADAIKEPKVCSFYSVLYDPQITGNPEINNLLITDDVREIVGSGSVVIEYDVVSGKVYSVWYSDKPGCTVIPDGRLEGRADRLREDVEPVGYYTGEKDD